MERRGNFGPLKISSSQKYSLEYLGRNNNFILSK
jgi:hypothetical protein